MRYKIEQWNNEKEYWFQVGESSSIIASSEIVRDLKNNNPTIFFRIVSVIQVD